MIVGVSQAAKGSGASTGPSLALHNLRTFVIFIVLAFHSFLAYLGSSPAAQAPFDNPPFGWRSIPIIDSERWYGFDFFCAHQDVYLISLLFFLSGLFVWPSLGRKGSGVFVRERLLRIGVPFALAVILVMPPAIYPVYRVTASDPSVSAYWQHWMALPFWPSGPPWFLWLLLVFDLAAALLFRFARPWGDALGRVTAGPAPFAFWLMSASAVAYVPLALLFKPWDWFQYGPFAFQLSRPLHYGVYFFAGVAIGAYGIDRGILAMDGWLVRRWSLCLGAAVATFALWLGMTALAMAAGGEASLAVQILQAFAFVFACGSSCLFVVAAFLRFADRRLRLLEAMRDSAYGMYLIHYVFVVWLQYLLMGVALFAIIKGMTVFAVTVALSWAATAGMLRFPAAARLIGKDARIATPIQRTAL
jgi:glucans biosynthesis protein C